MKKFLIIAGTLGAMLAGALSLGALSTPAFSQTAAKPVFKFCTAGKDGNYMKAGHILKKNVSSVAVEPIATEGSIDNLKKLVSGECDGAFVQSDSMLVFSSTNAAAISAIERAGVLYQEQVHLVCNRAAGISRIVDLRPTHKVAVGKDGSGAQTTMAGFKLADKKLYGNVQTDPKDGVRALAAVADGSEVQCMLYVAAIGAPLMKSDAAKLGDQIVLVAADDRDMAKSAKDARGKTVYSYGEIPSGTYPGIQPGGTMFGTKTVDTIQVDALFVGSTKWIDANSDAYSSVLRGFASSKAEINVKILGQKN